jgi:hypothetical protein
VLGRRICNTPRCNGLLLGESQILMRKALDEPIHSGGRGPLRVGGDGYPL